MSDWEIPPETGQVATGGEDTVVQQNVLIEQERLAKAEQERNQAAYFKGVREVSMADTQAADAKDRLLNRCLVGFVGGSVVGLLASFVLTGRSSS